MDNYKLEEVKKIIEENLLSSDVLKNILKSSTRRIENYDDHEAVEILSYLSNNDAVPTDTKEDINKYLAEYNQFHIDAVEKEKKLSKMGNNRLLIIYIVIIILLLVATFAVIRSR